jgi:hypothetical protein
MKNYDHLRHGKPPSKAVIGLLSVVLLLILACSGGAATPAKPAVKVTLPSASTKAAQPTPQVPPTAETKVSQPQEETFRDSFESPNGWAEAETDRYSAGRAEGGIYQISFWQAGDSDYVISYQPHQFSLPFRNMYIKGWGTALNGQGAYGLVCRYANAQNFYTFHISTDGRYWLYKRVSGDWTNLGTGTSPAIKEENTIEFECIDDRISASVNSMIIVEVNDTDLAEGNAGLFAQPLGGPVEDAWSYYAVFDSFEMTVLP